MKGLVKNVLIASSISLIGMTYSFAEVTLKVDDNTKVTAINGNAIKHSLFKPAQKTFTLQPGQHVVTAKYDRMFKFRNGDHDYVKSGEVTVTVNLDDNQTYELVWLNEPSKYNSVKDYAENPTLAITKGSQVIVQQVGTTGNRSGGFLSGLTGLFGGDGDSQTNNQQTIAAVNNNNVAATAPTYISQPIAPVASRANASTLDNFMQLWLQATPEERAKIRQWVQQ